MIKSVDVGTNTLISAVMDENEQPIFKIQRDAFFRVVPKSSVNSKSIKLSLDRRNASYIIDEDGSYIVVGNDALDMAIERGGVTERPLSEGVISAKSKASLPIIKLLLKNILGPGEENSKLVYSIPAMPIDQNFDVLYHEKILGLFFKELGYEASSINEAFAIGLSELLDSGLTGICVSCLVPGTKIYTDKGIVNIEDVKVGDQVITHKGRFKRVNNVITKDFDGVCNNINIKGYYGEDATYKFVDNHELYVNKDGEWSWIGCEELKVGDVVGEPILIQNLDRVRKCMCLCERVTNSSTYTKTSIYLGPDVYRLIGYFLGDGSIIFDNEGLQFDFGADELDNITDVQTILKKCFNKDSSITEKGDNCLRVKVYSKGLASWFRNKFYDSDKNKILPWSIERLTNNECLNLFVGLIRSDGKATLQDVSFYNTSTNLAMVCKQLFSRLGIAAHISVRGPRNSTLQDGRIIVGKKSEWTISSGKKSLFVSVLDLINTLNCDNSEYMDRLFINGNFCCSKIADISMTHYTGVVYDLQVEDDHSFSGPYLTIHNCGAGMANVCVMHEGDSLVNFSLTKSGDWIDNSVGRALDLSPSIILQEKEAGTDLYNPRDEISNAINVYFNGVIKYTIENIISELNKRKKELPRFKDPVPLVVSGGLTLANGFVRKFNENLSNLDFPIEISEVVRAKDPMTAVAHGCLLAAYL